MDPEIPQAEPVVEQPYLQTPVPTQSTPQTPSNNPLNKPKNVLIIMGIAIFLLGFVIGYFVKTITTRGTQTVAVIPTPTPSPSPTPQAIDPSAKPEDTTITVSPSSGPPGTVVHIVVENIALEPVDAHAFFTDSASLSGELKRVESLNKNIRPPEYPENGSGEFYAIIPDNVYNYASEIEGYPTEPVATKIGPAKIQISGMIPNKNLVAEFNVTEKKIQQ